MLKRNFIFFILLAGCSTPDEIEKKLLISSVPEPQGANCANGGIKVISGIDYNGNSLVDEGEISMTKVVCLPDLPPGYDGMRIGSAPLTNVSYNNLICPNGGLDVLISLDASDDGSIGDYETIFKYSFCQDKDGIHEIARAIKLPQMYITSDTSIAEATYLKNFNIANFEEFDEVNYSVEYYLSDNEQDAVVGWVQLFNKTDNVAITGTMLTLFHSGESPMTQNNFINNFPRKEIDLGVIITMKSRVGLTEVRTGFLEFSKAQ